MFSNVINVGPIGEIIGNCVTLTFVMMGSAVRIRLGAPPAYSPLLRDAQKAYVFRLLQCAQSSSRGGSPHRLSERGGYNWGADTPMLSYRDSARGSSKELGRLR